MKRSHELTQVKDQKNPTKRKKSRALTACSSITLSLDALSLVMEFLSPKQLYNMAFTCRTLRNLVTTKMVLQSALIAGGHAETTVMELHKLLSNQSMHVPSPLRLLRLVNGKRCEFCNQNNVKFARPSLGIFACWDCTTQSLTRVFNKTWKRYSLEKQKYDEVLDHPRIATNDCGSKIYMLSRRLTLQNGERVGPLAIFGDIDKMVSSRPKNMTVDEYIQKNLQTLSDTEDAYREFDQIYKDTMDRVKQVQREREQKRVEAKQKSSERKMANIEKMIAKLGDGLVKLGMKSSDVQAILKTKAIKFRYGTAVSKQPKVRFDLVFINDMMEEYVIAPSKIRKNHYETIVSTIKEKIDLIISPDFLSLGFLSDDDDFEAALKAHLGNGFSDIASLLNLKIDCNLVYFARRSGTDVPIASSRMNEKFFTLLAKEQFIDAIDHLHYNDLSMLLLSGGEDGEHEYSSEERMSARFSWLNHLSSVRDGSPSRRYHEAFEASKSL